MKKITKIVTTTIAITMFLSTIAIGSNIDQVSMKYLTKYNTQEILSLRGENIKIPTEFQYKDEQLRGVWISTVFNLDFPNKKNMTQEEYKANYIEVLDSLEALNMNTVIFQVRPKSDTFYKSQINPWSEYLMGTQGKDPNWDPMEWMIEETHKRGMEFHAWFNPYRVTTGNQTLPSLSDDNWAKKNPTKTFNYENKIYLNPGEPEVIKHVTDTVMEVVENYNIDAIHFDDYFYPNKRGSDVENFYTQGEKQTYDKYGQEFERVSDWRRDNIDRLISGINSSIEQYNTNNQTQVEFGISPFGIWGHEAQHPENAVEGQGSKTPITSTSSYDNQFADTRKWVKEEWVDYIVPQVYWAFDTAAAPYGEITHWWAETVRDTDVNLYIGHASYKKSNKDNKDNSWKNSEEILNQLKFNSMYDEIDGSMFFRYKSLLDNKDNQPANNIFISKLKTNYFNEKINAPSRKPVENTDLIEVQEIEAVEK